MSAFHFIQEKYNQAEIKRRFVLCPDNVGWAVTGDFTDVANNHCCATLLTNYSVFLDACRRRDAGRLRGYDYREVFNGVHHFVGNGPVLRIDPKANAWFASAGMNAHCKVIHGLSHGERAYLRIRDELLGGNPCALLVAAGLFNWHWIMAVGFVEYEDGGHQLLIVDNWTRRGFHLYYPGNGCRLLSCSVITEV